jgi:hypothetical protein
MANRPAHAGSGSIGTRSAGPRSAGPRSAGPRSAGPRSAGPRSAGPNSAGPSRGHRAARPRESADRDEAGARGLGWLPYLTVLAGVAAGMLVAWQGSKSAATGIAVVGGSLLAAALARLILPDRYAGLLASRRKASDVLAFAVLGTAVLAVVLSLP